MHYKGPWSKSEWKSFFHRSRTKLW